MEPSQSERSLFLRKLGDGVLVVGIRAFLGQQRRRSASTADATITLWIFMRSSTINS